MHSPTHAPPVFTMRFSSLTSSTITPTTACHYHSPPSPPPLHPLLIPMATASPSHCSCHGTLAHNHFVCPASAPMHAHAHALHHEIFRPECAKHRHTPLCCKASAHPTLLQSIGTAHSAAKHRHSPLCCKTSRSRTTVHELHGRVLMLMNSTVAATATNTANTTPTAVFACVAAAAP
jgi:hypothetical protein